MAVWNNNTQKKFTMISNSIFQDKELSMKDIGVLCSLCSIPDEAKFSIEELNSMFPDKVIEIYRSIISLQKLGYIEITNADGEDTKYIIKI